MWRHARLFTDRQCLVIAETDPTDESKDERSHNVIGSPAVDSAAYDETEKNSAHGCNEKAAADVIDLCKCRAPSRVMFGLEAEEEALDE